MTARKRFYKDVTVTEDLGIALDGRPVKTHMTDLCEKLAELAAKHGAWVRLHYVYPYPHVDDVIPLMADGKILPFSGDTAIFITPGYRFRARGCLV